MKIPKRFELHLAAGEDTGGMQLDAIRILNGRVCATDGVIVASVPLTLEGIRAEPGEELLNGAVIAPKGWAAATRGSQGEGTLRLEFGAQVVTSGDKKPALHFQPPVREPGSEEPPIASVLELARQMTNPVEVILDAEALYRLSCALGAKEGLRLRFEVGPDGKRTSEFVVAEPAEGGGAEGVLMPIVLEGQ